MQSTVQTAPSEDRSAGSDRLKTLSVAVVATALVLEIIDVSIVNVAIPLLKADLSATGAQIEWITAGYVFFFAVFLLVGGRLGDIFGYRRIFMLGLAAFGLASAGCGLVGNAETLIAMRILQGISGALMGPQVLAIVQVLYAPHERFKVMGIFGLLGGVAGVLGPILGGTLIEFDLFGLGWRPIFLINVPVVAVALILAARVLPAGGAGDTPRLDLFGAVLAIVGFGAFLLALIEGPALGWPFWAKVLPLLSLGFLLILSRHLKARERNGLSALVPVAVFKDGVFLTGIAIALLYQVATASLLLATSLVLQSGLGFSPLATSLLHVPFALGAAVSIALIGRRLLPKLGRNMAPIGVAAQIAGLLLMAHAIAQGTDGAALALLCLGFGLCGCGMGLISAPLPAFALARIAVSHAGAAAGVFRTGQQLGAALGIATLGGLYLSTIAAATSPEDHASAFTSLAHMQVSLLIAIAALSRLLPANAHRKH